MGEQEIINWQFVKNYYEQVFPRSIDRYNEFMAKQEYFGAMNELINIYGFFLGVIKKNDEDVITEFEELENKFFYLMNKLSKNSSYINKPIRMTYKNSLNAESSLLIMRIYKTVKQYYRLLFITLDDINALFPRKEEDTTKRGMDKVADKYNIDLSDL